MTLQKIKKYLIVISPIVILIISIYLFRNTASVSTIENSRGSDKKGIEMTNNNGNHSLEKNNSSERLVKLHLLTKKEEKRNLVRESRNIFLAKNIERNMKDSIWAETEANTKEQSNPAENIELQIPQFPYIVIGSIKMYESSDYSEFAVIFNGFENLFVKEGDMIDSVFQLIKINEDDVDIRYSGNDGIIKVEIKGR